MAVLIQLRRGDQDWWLEINPVLAQGEPALNTTTSDLRIGDGLTRWSELTPFYPDKDLLTRLSYTAIENDIVRYRNDSWVTVSSNILIEDNIIKSINQNGNIVIAPDGNGVITVNNTRITNLANPLTATDAVNKNYVDAIEQGLYMKPAASYATTVNLDGEYDNGVNGIGATLSVLTETLTIDENSSWELSDTILVKNQTLLYQNGLYALTQLGNDVTPWVLTRSIPFNENDEIPSSYVFVQNGRQNRSTGWVAVVEDYPNFDIGVDDISWIQFSGAGSYMNGEGISLNGTIFSLHLNANGGLTVGQNGLEIKSTTPGSGLTLNSGVLSVVGTENRITAHEDSIDIADTYVGQSSINTLGAVTTGEWQATTIETIHGGTGLTAYSKGDLLYASDENTLQTLPIDTNGRVLRIADGQPIWSDVDGNSSLIQLKRSATPNEILTTFPGELFVNSNDGKLYLTKDDTSIIDVTSPHNNVTGLQGGDSNEYYHLTESQYTDLVNIGLAVSTANEKVGIGTETPLKLLHVGTNTNYIGLSLDGPSDSTLINSVNATGLHLKSSVGNVNVISDTNSNLSVVNTGGYSQLTLSGSSDNRIVSLAGDIKISPASEMLTVQGGLSHTGLTATDGLNVDQLKIFTINLTLRNDWQDTTISNDMLATGTFIVQLYANDGININEHYSGIMSWYTGPTQSASEMPTDEIQLHRAGGSDQGVEIYLRTYRSSATSGEKLKLQIYSNHTYPSASNYVFKFRRMI